MLLNTPCYVVTHLASPVLHLTDMRRDKPCFFCKYAQ